MRLNLFVSLGYLTDIIEKKREDSGKPQKEGKIRQAPLCVKVTRAAVRTRFN